MISWHNQERFQETEVEPCQKEGPRKGNECIVILEGPVACAKVKMWKFQVIMDNSEEMS